MKTIFILRHASASPSGFTQDIERNLDELGVKEAKNLQQLLRSQAIVPSASLVSPANRTRQTFEYVFGDGKGGYVTPLNIVPRLYNANYLTLLEHIRSVDDSIDSLVVIAHNPGVSHLATYLNAQGEGFQLPTAGLLQFKFNGKKWCDVGEGKCTLVKRWY